MEWADGGVELLTEQRQWPSTGRPRRAAVSSFGLSGTNAHVVLEQAPEPEPAPHPDGPAVVPWLLSGRDAEGLAAVAARLTHHLAEREAAALPLDPAAVGAALRHRNAMQHRVVLVGDRDDLLSGLEDVAAGRAPGSVAHRGARTAVLLSGQGSQRLGMGRELAEAFPVFRDTFDRVVAQADARLAGWSAGADSGCPASARSSGEPTRTSLPRRSTPRSACWPCRLPPST